MTSTVNPQKLHTALLTCRYASHYLTRNSLAFTAPMMIKDSALGLDMTAIGGLTSIMPVAYAFSKFLSGVVGARTSPVLLLAGRISFQMVMPGTEIFGKLMWGLGLPACCLLHAACGTLPECGGQHCDTILHMLNAPRLGSMHGCSEP